MIDAEAVAVAALSERFAALASPDVDLSQRIPCLVIETASSTPTVNGPTMLTSVTVIQIASLADSRAEARDQAWEALEMIDQAAGFQCDYGDIAHVAIQQVPIPVSADIPIPDLFRFDIQAQLTLCEHRKA